MEAWRQIYDPMSNLWLSALIAALPIFLFFTSLIVLKLKGWVAALLTVSLSLIVAIFAYKMPILLALMSFVQGFMTGLWPIAWIILTAIFLYKLSLKSGYFEILKQSIMTITPDHRVQVILIAFCFGAFLEGAIGFGAPVAITAALLMGLGLKPLHAAGLGMVANTAGAAFGAVGIPILALAKAIGFNDVELDTLSTMVARMLPPITFLIPFFLVCIMDGIRGLKQTFIHAFVAASSFTLTQYLTASILGPELTNITSAIAGIICTSISLKIFKIKEVFRLDGSNFSQIPDIKGVEILKAWLPFIFLIGFIFLWTTPFLKNLVAFADIKFQIPFLHNAIIQAEPIVAKAKPMPAIYNWEIIKAVGTAILLAAIFTIFALKIKFSIIKSAAKEATSEMLMPILTIGLVVAYASIAKNSGQAATMGLALANTGSGFAFFSPIIGWIGVFLTGSVTSSNLLFGTLQQVTASQLNVPEIIFLAANTVGGVVGKIISPQSIAVACAAVGLAGREGELFKFTLKYSLMFIILASSITWLVINVFTGLIPTIVNFNIL